MNFEQFLEAKGFGDGKDLNDVQRASLLAAWKAEVAGAGGGNGNGTPPPTKTAQQVMDEALQAARAEQDREHQSAQLIRAAVDERRISVDVAEDLGRRTFAEKWDRQRLELELLRAGRPSAPGIMASQDSRPDPADVIEAAVCIAGGLEGIDKHFPERTLEAAHKRWRHGLSLSDLLMTFARRNGYDGVSVKANLKRALECSFSADVQAAGSWGPSTGGGLSGILSNVANKFLKSGFDSVDQAWRRVAAIRSVNDFKTITSYSLTGGLSYDQVPPGGELKHGQLGAETYTNAVNTFGKMIGLDRRDLINDDLGALTGVSRRLGRGGALKVNNVFWSVFLNNSGFFTAGRGNVSTGAGSALSIAGLDAAYAKFAALTDPDGEPMGSTPKILLVPTALYATATQLMSSTMLTIGSGTAAAGSANPWAGMFTVVTSPYLSNASYTGYSTAAWYLLSDPADVPVVEMAFLNGQESPTVESADADFGMLGIAMRGYHDLGAALQEYRAGIRSAGS